MGDPLHEQLSAFIDGELSRDEGDLFVRRVPRDAGLRSAASRYYLIGQAIRAEHSAVRDGFATRVMTAVRQDTRESGAAAVMTAMARALPSKRWSGWWKPAAGVGIAASVAVIAIFVFQNQQRARDLPQIAQATPAVVLPQAPAVAEPAPATVHTGSGEPSSYVVPPAGTGVEPPLGAARLASYVLAHSEYSSLPGRRNVVSDAAVQETQPDPVPAGAPSP